MDVLGLAFNGIGSPTGNVATNGFNMSGERSITFGSAKFISISFIFAQTIPTSDADRKFFYFGYPNHCIVLKPTNTTILIPATYYAADAPNAISTGTLVFPLSPTSITSPANNAVWLHILVFN